MGMVLTSSGTAGGHGERAFEVCGCARTGKTWPWLGDFSPATFSGSGAEGEDCGCAK